MAYILGVTSTVSKSIIKYTDHDTTSSEVYKIVEAVIGVKSTYTALSRANCLLAYVKWVLPFSLQHHMCFKRSLSGDTLACFVTKRPHPLRQLRPCRLLDMQNSFLGLKY